MALESVVQAAGLDEALSESFPASDPVAIDHDRDDDAPFAPCGCGQSHELPSDPVSVTLDDGTRAAIGHGHVVIAAITSCTNTSNPSVMIGAGLLAKKAVERGLSRQPWVKTTLAPGSRVVTDYYDRAGLTPYLERLGFSLVGYGCTTCIGNSGPLIPQVSAAVTGHDLTVCSVLSGNRNFEGRIHPECKMNFLTSPPLVIAYALTGTMLADLLNDPLGTDSCRAAGVSAGHLAQHPGGQGGDRRVRTGGDVHPRLRRRARRRRRLAGPRRRDRADLRLGRRLHLCPPPPVLRRNAPGTGAGR